MSVVFSASLAGFWQFESLVLHPISTINMTEEEMIESIAPKDWANSDEIIKVLGVGGGGCNAVNYMYTQGIKGCTFVVCNSDSPALYGCSVPLKIPIGDLGAGTNPEVGRKYAVEHMDRIAKVALDSHTKMLFLTAGMGGGTGTGASPVIAELAKSRGILTVGVVTIPFLNEGDEAMTRAIDGIHELQKHVDSLIIINNEKLHEFYGNLLIRDALPKADEVLATAVRSIIEIIKMRGYINVDFMDVETMMRNSGLALMGCGVGRGENRVEDAVKSAFESPLLNDFDLKTAHKVLVNISCSSGDQGLTMDDMSKINKLIDEYTGRGNRFKRGLIWDDDPEMGDTVRITSIVTGLRFVDVVRPQNLGNYISIGRNFVYDRETVAGTEGISLPEDAGTRRDFQRDNIPTFKLDPDKRPVLVVSSNQSIAELESVPAIRRARALPTTEG